MTTKEEIKSNEELINAARRLSWIYSKREYLMTELEEVERAYKEAASNYDDLWNMTKELNDEISRLKNERRENEKMQMLLR